MVMAVAGYPDSEVAILEAARRLDIAGVAAPMLAAGAGLRVLDQLGALREIDPDVPLTQVLRIASRDDLKALGPLVAKALRERDSDLWEAYLEAAREGKKEVDQGFLSAGLSSKELIPATLWHALASGAHLEAPLEPAPTGEEAFLVELLQRRAGQKPRESKAWIAARKAGEETPFSEIREPGSNGILVLLTRNERRALSSQIRMEGKALDDWYDRAREAVEDSDPPEGPIPRIPTMRTIADFPDGFVASVLEATGCAPITSVGVGSAEVEYSLAGRPVRVRFHPYPVEPEECSAASRALVLNSIVEPDLLSPKPDWSTLLVLLEPDFLSCVSEPRAQARVEWRSVTIEPPNKTRDVAPVYPPSARESRISGTVTLEALITESGCLRAIRTLESPDSRLTLASIVAVSRWRYRPSSVEGKPVALTVTVAVSFSLR
jgi:TonB family protein